MCTDAAPLCRTLFGEYLNLHRLQVHLDHARRTSRDSAVDFANFEAAARLDRPRGDGRRVVQDAESVAVGVYEEVDEDPPPKISLRAGVRDDEHLLVVENSREGEHARSELGCAEMNAITRDRSEVQATITKGWLLVANRRQLLDCQVEGVP